MARAVCSFTYGRPDGSQGFVSAGDVLPDDDEAVVGREALFADVMKRPASESKVRTRKS